MPNEKPCNVFVSYSTKDAVWAQEFAEALRNAGISTWSDNDIKPGAWEIGITQALRESNTFVLVLSNHSINSSFVLFELGAAVADRKKNHPRINRRS